MIFHCTNFHENYRQSTLVGNFTEIGQQNRNYVYKIVYELKYFITV